MALEQIKRRERDAPSDPCRLTGEAARTPAIYRRLSAESLRDALRKMHLIRRFEESAEDAYMRGLVHGTMHLSIGQEASAVGVCTALEPTRFHHLDASRPRPLHRQGRAGVAHVRGILRQGGRLLPRSRRLDAYRRCVDRQSRRERHRRGRHPDRGRRGAVHEEAEAPVGGRFLLRGRRQQRGRVPRSAQYGFGLEAPRRLRLREQRIRHVDLDRALDRGQGRGRARRRLFDAGPSSSTAMPSRKWRKLPSTRSSARVAAMDHR